MRGREQDTTKGDITIPLFQSQEVETFNDYYEKQDHTVAETTNFLVKALIEDTMFY